MAEEIKIEDVMSAVKEIREEVEKKSPDHEKIEKLEKSLTDFEDANQKQLAEFKAVETKNEELQERLDALETEIARKSVETGVHYKETEEYKALQTLIVGGEMQVAEQFSAEERKQLLRTDSDTDGGYLVMGEMDNMITKKITEISNIRSVARVRTIGSKSLEVPVRNGILTATYEGEAEQDELSTSNYSNETLTAYAQSVTVPITKDMLMDAAFDMESEIFTDASEAFAQGEGRNFVLGDGVKKPTGFIFDNRVASNARPTSTASTVDADDVILLTGDLKTGYNPVYIMNRRTLAFLRTLKSTTGSFLWQPGLNGPVANTINGFPYLIAEDMPDIANGAYPIAFGDFQRGYTIVDRTGVNVVRDELTRKRNRIVEFTLNRWNTGQVTLPEAIKLLQVTSP